MYVRDYNLIVAQKAGNTTSLFGEFKGKNLPIWQVFGGFTTTRIYGALRTLLPAAWRTLRSSFQIFIELGSNFLFLLYCYYFEQEYDERKKGWKKVTLTPEKIPNAFPLVIYEDFRKRYQGFSFYVGMCESTLNLFVNSKPENLIKVKDNLYKLSNNDGIWNRSFENFITAFKDAPKPPLQVTLFALAFNWDFFINNIGKFIFIASHFYDQISFHKYLLNLHVGGFEGQLSKIRKSTKIDFQFNSDDYLNSVEFFEVRHLGVHNGWTIDDNYLKFSPNKSKYQKNEYRIFTGDEIEKWSRSLLTIAKTISETLADTFTDTYSSPGNLH